MDIRKELKELLAEKLEGDRVKLYRANKSKSLVDISTILTSRFEVYEIIKGTKYEDIVRQINGSYIYEIKEEWSKDNLFIN